MRLFRLDEHRWARNNGVRNGNGTLARRLLLHREDAQRATQLVVIRLSRFMSGRSNRHYTRTNRCVCRGGNADRNALDGKYDRAEGPEEASLG